MKRAVSAVHILIMVCAIPAFVSSQTAITPEFPVDPAGAGVQDFPDVGMDNDGDFTVVWQAPDASFTGIYARRYGMDGTPRDDTFAVNTGTSGPQSKPKIGVQPTDVVDNLVVAWLDDSSGGAMQPYRGNGAPIGGETAVGSGADLRVDVEVAADENFIVVWEREDEAGGRTFVEAQRFFPDGSLNGGVTYVDDVLNDFETGGSGDIVIYADHTVDVPMWHSLFDCTLDCPSEVTTKRINPDNSIQLSIWDTDTIYPNLRGLELAADLNGHRIGIYRTWWSTGLVRFARSYSGSTWSSTDAIDGGTYWSSSGLDTAIASFGERFVAAWIGRLNPNSDYHVYARLLGPSPGGGAPISDIFQVSETPVSTEATVQVAGAPTHTFAVTWRGGASGDSVMARVYATDLLFSDGFESGNPQAWSD